MSEQISDITAAQIELDALTEKRDTLALRLDTGALKIEEARAVGRDVSDWEDFWMFLLRKHENAHAQILALQELIEILNRKAAPINSGAAQLLFAA